MEKKKIIVPNFYPRVFNLARLIPRCSPHKWPRWSGITRKSGKRPMHRCKKCIGTCLHFSLHRVGVQVKVLEPSLAKGNRVMVFCNTLNSSRAMDHFLSENQIDSKLPWGGASRGNDVRDVLTSLDHVSEKGLVDASKVAVLGGSHGGFLTTHLIGQFQSQKFQYTIQTQTQDIPDAQTYLLTLKEIRAKSGLIDNFGAEAMMMEALEKVEKEIKKPLLRSNKKNMALLHVKFDKINKKLGIRMEDLPKYE